MRDLAGRRTVIAASVAPKAHMRATRTLATAGARVRGLEQRLAVREAQIATANGKLAIAHGRIEAGELIEVEAARQFEKLLDMLDQHLGIAFLPDELSRQLELIADLLGVERRWSP